MVASVAAGKQEKSDTSPMHGVAFEANVLFIAIQLAEPDPDYDPVDLGTDDGSGNVTELLTLLALIIFLAPCLKSTINMMLIL